jgi:hypothetical protein
MEKTFKAAALGVVATLSFALLLPAQSGPVASQQDIVEQLLPNGEIPKEVVVKPEQRDRVIKILKVAQNTADAQRAQQVAFLLAALDSDYDRNRDYLLHVLSGCNYPEIRYGCDDMAGFYLIYLWEHGHPEILAPLLRTSIGSYNAAGSEGLGAFFGDLVQKSPEKFLDAVGTFPVSTQKKACSFAGMSDGGGLGAKGLAQARKKLRGIGSEVALRCLKEIEDSNKPE